MSKFATTSMSSKGQVVIPESIRHMLGLHSGDQFIVLADKDTVVLKTIKRPSLEEFKLLLSNARKQAKAAGLKKSHVKAEIEAARRKK